MGAIVHHYSSGVTQPPLLASAWFLRTTLHFAGIWLQNSHMKRLLPQVGDWVKVLHVEGLVKSVTLRHTTIVGFDHNVYTVNNSDIHDAVVMNVSNATETRVYCSFYISPSHDPGRVEEFYKAFREQVSQPQVKGLFMCIIRHISHVRLIWTHLFKLTSRFESLGIV